MFVLFDILLLGLLCWFVVAAGTFVIPVAATGFAGLYLAAYVRAYAGAMGVGGWAAPVAVPDPPMVADDKAEPAYRQYLFGPAVADLRRTFELARPELRRTFLNSRFQINSRFSWRGWRSFRWPVRLLLWIGLLVGTVFGGILVGLLVVAQFLVWALLVGVGQAAVYLLRGVDTVLLRVRGIRMRCPNCYEHVPYPSYECPNDRCSRRHRDVRPGRYGVLRRICGCGAKMPTLLVLGSHRLKAFCPRCRQPMAERVGTASETALPVLGAQAAGKTRLMLVTVLALTELVNRSGAKARFADNESSVEFERLIPAVRQQQPTRGTIVRMPRAYSLYVTPPRGKERLVHIFDAAGEHFRDSARAQELQYMRTARSFLFVIDPLSVDAFWESLGPADQQRLRPFRAPRSPEFVFQQALDNIAAMQGEPRRARLAVAVTKSDLVRDTAMAQRAGQDSESIGSWLAGPLGLDNMHRTMRRAFADVRFFRTSAVLDDDRADPEIDQLISWLLAGEGLRLHATDSREVTT